MTEVGAERAARPPLRGLLRSLALNAGVPFALYALSRRFLHASEAGALCVAAVFPLADAAIGLARRRRVDVIAALTLVSVAIGLVGVALGGDPRVLLIRESFFTAALGAACIGSLLLPRPLMFHIGRQFVAGDDAARLARYDRLWARPDVRRLHRAITAVWGAAMLGEFAVRVALVYTLPAGAVLAVSPLILGAVIVVTMLWTYGRARAWRSANPTAGR